MIFYSFALSSAIVANENTLVYMFNAVFKPKGKSALKRYRLYTGIRKYMKCLSRATLLDTFAVLFQYSMQLISGANFHIHHLHKPIGP